MSTITPGQIARARVILWAGWRARARELGRPEPVTLAGSCKFSAILAQALFGGRIRANWQHTWCEVAGAVIDLTDGAGLPVGIEAYRHDPGFARRPEFRDSLGSCRSRVGRWLDGAAR